ncbi:MAG: dihydroorotate dehydrogenase [Gemmatimonadota bacterium]|nr:MAG: dihydroorotate dehydrogenase [Gemmatimonadota bacterium]
MLLEQTIFGARFRNPVMLAAGTCGFGEELVEVTDLDMLGGLVTKSVTLEARRGNPAPRVAEVGSAMINSIGLTNPGLDAVRTEKLPWIREHLGNVQVFVSVAGHTPDEYFTIVEMLNEESGFLGFEINLSCPNDSRLGGLPFALDHDALEAVVRGVRSRTRRPVLAKLAPNDPAVGATAALAAGAGADGVTLVNTLPGLVIDPTTRQPLLGAGPGGVSGPAMRAVGVHAVWEARKNTAVPLLGVGGISTGEDAVQYLLAGASLVQVGTASFADPRAGERVVGGLRGYGKKMGIAEVGELVGAMRPPGGSDG